MKVGVAIDTPMDFSRFNSATYLGCAYLGAMACCNGNSFHFLQGFSNQNSDEKLQKNSAVSLFFSTGILQEF